jgi:hypothetical protein
MSSRHVGGRQHCLRAWGLASVFGLALAGHAMAQSQAGPPLIPSGASALEGTPSAKVEASPERSERRELDTRGHTDDLRIRIVDGRYYWASRQDRPLTLTQSGEFTYLSSSEPGQYIRFRRMNDRTAYVEHVDMGLRSVTYWGELRIVLGK